ncbi:MAG: LacI family DNA-binding transcriptional regulator [Spirochaetota bacterium]
MEQRITLKDLAQAAGVSVAAVSMILAGKGKISAPVAERVRNLATELGYKNNLRSPKLLTRRFKYVSILQREDFPYLWNFSQPFATWLEEQVIQKGYYPIILHIPPTATSTSVFKEITGARIGAVFAIHYADPVLFSELEAAGIPVIIVNNSEYQTRFFSVLADEVQGSCEATMHLIDLGHRRIGYADYLRPNYPTLVNDRFFGFRKAISENNLESPDGYRVEVNLPDFDTLLGRIGEIYRQPSPPTAFAVHDDYFAAYILEALNRIGKQVPRDVSLIATGGDVLDYRVPFIRKIDTMQIDQRLMVSMAWNLLEARLQQPGGPIQVLKTRMPYIDRGSCRFDMD